MADRTKIRPPEPNVRLPWLPIRLCRRWQHWKLRDPWHSWFYIPSYSQYAWDYRTPQEDLARRRRLTNWRDITTRQPIIPLWPQGTPRDTNTNREILYFLHGREQEFNWFARRIIAQPNGISLITGPPGVGKTALLAALSEYARRQKYIIIDIPPEVFLDCDTLCQVMRDQALHQQQAGILHHHTRQSGLQANIRIPKLPIDFNLSAEAAQTRRRIGEEKILQTLREILAANPHAPGILITCDEVQNIRAQELRDLDHPGWDIIKDHFIPLNDAIGRGKAHLPVTTIIAGVPPAKKVYEKALSRSAASAYIHLRPVATAHCEMIIRDYLNVTDDRGIKPIQYKNADIRRWAVDCRGHVLHANNAGQILQEKGIAIARQKTAPDTTEMAKAMDDIQGRIEKTKTALYRRQIKNTGQHELVHHLIIAAAHKPEGAIPESIAHAITSHVLQEEGKTYTPKDIEQAIEPLERYGLIQVIEDGDHFVHRQTGTQHTNPTYWEVAIPSLQTFIHQQITSKTERERLRQAIAPFLDEAAYAGLPWNWDGTITLQELPRIKDKDVSYPPELETQSGQTKSLGNNDGDSDGVPPTANMVADRTAGETIAATKPPTQSTNP